MSAKSKAGAIGLWVLRVLVAALFLFAAFLKLTSQPQMVAEFNETGFGHWFRFLTGALELTGGLLILVPRFSPFAALLLLAVDAGALVAQLAVLHKDWVHVIAIGAVLGVLVYFQRAALAKLGKLAV